MNKFVLLLILMLAACYKEPQTFNYSKTYWEKIKKELLGKYKITRYEVSYLRYKEPILFPTDYAQYTDDSRVEGVIVFTENEFIYQPKSERLSRVFPLSGKWFLADDCSSISMETYDNDGNDEFMTVIPNLPYVTSWSFDYHTGRIILSLETTNRSFYSPTRDYYETFKQTLKMTK